MSIKTFSKPEFVNVVKDILQHGEWFGLRNADKLTEQSSFRDVLDITSLDIAELMVEIEEKYNVNMEFAETGEIDSINDVYRTFIQSINNMRKQKITTPVKQR